MKKTLRCHLSLHSWRKMSNDDGSYRFRKCRRCGKEEAPQEPPHWSATGGGG
jgi:rRNA maturation protein Nop10